MKCEMAADQVLKRFSRKIRKEDAFRRLEAFETLIVAANAEATVAIAYLTDKESREEFGEAVKALEAESELLRQRVACLLDEAGNENLDL